MHIRRVVFVALLATFLSVFTAAPAGAATIVTAFVTHSFGPSQTNFDAPITFAQFDPDAHGGFTLNSVHIILEGTAQSGPGGRVTCDTGGGNGTCDGDLTSSITLTLMAPGNLLLAQVIPLTTFTYTGVTPGTTVIPPTQTDTKNSGTIIYTADFDPAIIQAFLGTGDITLNLHGQGLVNASNGNGFVISGNPLTGSGTVQVAYDFNDDSTVPEPAAFVLLGSGLLGIALFRRKR